MSDFLKKLANGEPDKVPGERRDPAGTEALEPVELPAAVRAAKERAAALAAPEKPDDELTDDERAASPYADVREPVEVDATVEAVARRICEWGGGRPDKAGMVGATGSTWRTQWKAYVPLAQEVVSLAKAK